MSEITEELEALSFDNDFDPIPKRNTNLQSFNEHHH